MDTNELISIIITTYARPATLKRAIDSVLCQTYKNLEIIVVDDNKDKGIQNEVKGIISSYNDPRIKLVCNVKNLGGALSRNEGILVANGKYIAFLDDDDEYLPEKVEEQYQLFLENNNENLALVYGYCTEIGLGNHRKLYHYDFVGNCLFEAMVDCIAATSQWMCKKTALLAVNMFSDVPCKQDSTVILKLLIAGYTVDRVPRYLSIYHTDEINRISSGNHQKRILGEETLRELCRKNYVRLTPEQINEVEYSFDCRLAEHYLALGKKDEFIDSIKNVISHPFRRKSLATFKHLFYNVIHKCNC